MKKRRVSAFRTLGEKGTRAGKEKKPNGKIVWATKREGSVPEIHKRGKGDEGNRVGVSFSFPGGEN